MMLWISIVWIWFECVTWWLPVWHYWGPVNYLEYETSLKVIRLPENGTLFSKGTNSEIVKYVSENTLLYWRSTNVWIPLDFPLAIRTLVHGSFCNSLSISFLHCDTVQRTLTIRQASRASLSWTFRLQNSDN